MLTNVQLPKVNTGPFRFGTSQKPDQSEDFRSWLKRVTPTYNWDWLYLDFIRQNLNKVTNGEIKRLMLFVPPRHGKSEMVTVRYPAYRLKQNPSLRVIVGSYNQTLANKFSRKTRRIAREDNIALSAERSAVEDWETESGGGLRSIGVGGGITGHGGNLIIIDDPVKSREDAASQTYRDKTYDWYTDDLYTRLEPGGAIILIMTRWHEDDLAGRILNSEDGENWTVISLPAIAEENDPIGRRPGETLNPDRYSKEDLRKIQTVLGKAFQGLYQQRPQEQEGDMFKRSWFEIVSHAPEQMMRVRYWDKAATANDGDWTVGTLMGYEAGAGIFYIEDVIRGQWSSGQRDKVILQTAEQDRKRYGDVRIFWEEEPGSSGKDASAAMSKLLVGYAAFSDKVTGDKAIRAEPLAAQAEALNIKLVKGKWFDNWIDEITTFPNGAHDDQVDSASGAFNQLAKVGPLILFEA